MADCTTEALRGLAKVARMDLRISDLEPYWLGRDVAVNQRLRVPAPAFYPYSPGRLRYEASRGRTGTEQ